MAVNQTAPSKAEIQKWFLDSPKVADNTFEFALALGGTVSAGAYTAGALDFLIQALDCFSEASLGGKAPKHQVLLKLITGTSGGGVNAAIAARALAFSFPHVTSDTPVNGLSTGNPFHDVWVNTLRLKEFLNLSDANAQGVSSLLNGGPIDLGGRQIVSFRTQPKNRQWVNGPLRIILTLTSLRGVPYKIDFGGGLNQSYVDHADYMRFAVLYPGHQIGADAVRPDERVLPFDNITVPQPISWNDFSEVAKATAAFPIGFPTRLLNRPTNDYRYRLTPYPNGDGYITLQPNWDAMRDASNQVPDQWQFPSVDGGMTDNEPIELARSALGGFLAEEARDANSANRAVFLIDPFAGETDLGSSAQPNLPGVLSGLLNTFTQQTRYDSTDLLMAADERIFSRFMLTANLRWIDKKQRVGGAALASSGLSAFIGFACPEFMRFDYLLGRRNCQEYLRREFLLGEANPIFSKWTAEERERFSSPETKGFLPIIPLIGDAAKDVELDPWPKGQLSPESYRNALQKRCDEIVKQGLTIMGVNGPIDLAVPGMASGPIVNAILLAMDRYLVSADLN